jgi:hypothetical protein
LGLSPSSNIFLADVLAGERVERVIPPGCGNLRVLSSSLCRGNERRWKFCQGWGSTAGRSSGACLRLIRGGSNLSVFPESQLTQVMILGAKSAIMHNLLAKLALQANELRD